MEDVPLSPAAKITIERRGQMVLIGINRPYIHNRTDPDASRPLLGAVGAGFRARLAVVVSLVFAVSVITGPANSFFFVAACFTLLFCFAFLLFLLFFFFVAIAFFPSRLYSTTLLRKLGNPPPLTSLVPLPPLL